MPVRFGIHGPMISAQGDLQNRVYKLLTGASGKRWLVAVQDDAAENIYVEGGPRSQGFGGATLSFTLEDGTDLELTGPWKAGSAGLLKDTGYDVTDTHFTRGVIAFDMIAAPWPKPDFYVGVIHLDDEPVRGSYDRIGRLAQDFSNRFQRRIRFAFISKGGGSLSFCDPKVEQSA